MKKFNPRLLMQNLDLVGGLAIFFTFLSGLKTTSCKITQRAPQFGSLRVGDSSS